MPATIPAVRSSPIQHSRASPIVTSQQPQPEASSSRRREMLAPLHFLLPKDFSKGIVGIFELPEKIQIRRMKIQMLWPGCLEKLIGIVGR
ncbi:hypothetical protein O181_048171 [Austropuccinia psidii MF-1]|uniref:Uncharacterized protein n=1 Tax=Austropuccinia psidii MF-1 TaxID=1389203 RepID=A0A9Q3DQ71_9BASI|nr:hypothetical protein [Austropuccinia psidii MF-1]